MERDETKAKGGHARAKSLSPSQREEIARKAAEARWNADLPKATHGTPDHPLKIGDIELPCYVLEDGRRVLHQRGMVDALGMSRGSSGGTGGDRLAKFVAGDRLKPFLKNHLITVTESPIKFKTTVGQLAYGYEATVLADICEAVLAAREAKALQKQQEHIAKQCEILVRGFARVGIIALVDEVTGYQFARTRDELQRLLEQYVSKELARWERTFEADFYRHLYRLKEWPYDPTSTKRSHCVARITVDLTYDRIHPDILKELKQIRHEKGKPSSKLFQWMTTGPAGGHPRLKQHLEGITVLMKVAKNWGQFMWWVDQHYPKLNQTMLLPFSDPEEWPEGNSSHSEES